MSRYYGPNEEDHDSRVARLEQEEADRLDAEQDEREIADMELDMGNTMFDDQDGNPDR